MIHKTYKAYLFDFDYTLRLIARHSDVFQKRTCHART